MKMKAYVVDASAYALALGIVLGIIMILPLAVLAGLFEEVAQLDLSSWWSGIWASLMGYLYADACDKSTATREVQATPWAPRLDVALVAGILVGGILACYPFAENFLRTLLVPAGFCFGFVVYCSFFERNIVSVVRRQTQIQTDGFNS